MRQLAGMGPDVMRRLSWDQYEFNSPSSEQSLEVAISSRTQHRDLSSFLLACMASAQSGPPIRHGWPNWQSVMSDLQKHVGLAPTHPSEFRESILLSDEWNLRELAFEAGPLLVWYRWSTSA
jgi:hypothetical protein